MGRPKKDVTNNACSTCPATGIPITKGQCYPCYRRDYFKSHNTGETRQRRIDNASNWNKANRQRINSMRKGEEVPSLEKPAEPCTACGNSYPIHANGMCVHCYGKHRHKEFYPKYRNQKIAKQYGIDADQYQKMLDVAEGRCAICHELHSRLCVDHDHKTKKVRGLLCHSCNILVGWMEKADCAAVEEAIRYLKSHSQEPTNAQD